MNYAYCPRIVYFERVLRATQATTIKELAGREKHAVENKLERRRESKKQFNWTRKLRETRLESKELGCTTILDLLLVDDLQGIAVPMQLKNTCSPPKLYRGQKMQVLLEAVLVEESLGLKVPFGLVKFLSDSKVFRVDADDFSKQQLKTNLLAIQSMVRGENMPAPTEFEKRCTDCCFKRICGRV